MGNSTASLLPREYRSICIVGLCQGCVMSKSERKRMSVKGLCSQ